VNHGKAASACIHPIAVVAAIFAHAQTSSADPTLTNDGNLHHRQELVTWLNSLLQLNITKVEQCGTG
jgi:hypothetical protein